MRSIYGLILIPMLTILPGCSFSKTPSWMRGDWIFDVETSQKAVLESVATTANGTVPNKDSIAQVLAKIGKLGDVQLKITDTEIKAFHNGNGNAEKFEVVSIIPNQECLIRRADGIMETFYKAGDEIYTFPDSGAQVKFFFKRKS